MSRLAIIVSVALFCMCEARLAHSKDAHHSRVLREEVTSGKIQKQGQVTPPKLPEQGYEGKGVKHENYKSITSDWGTEYGPTTQKPVPARSSASQCSVFFAAAALVVVTMQM